MSQLLNQEDLSFSSIPLSPQLARAVKDMNYTSATSIQAAAIPFLLDGQDLIGHSSTGTGKTAAFGIPAVELVNGEVKRAQVLVLSPTRELAMQIAREMQKYSKYKDGVSVAAVYGGAPMSEQIRQLRRANIIIGTPGRLMDHLRRKTLKMDDIKMVILDEADEMLSMGFIEDIQTILSATPDERQTVLFSATMPAPILKISREFLTEPQVVDVVQEQKSQAQIEQSFYYVPQHKKQEALALLLQHSNAGRSIIFCNTKSMVDELAQKLTVQGLKATGLHGDMTQAVRSQVMDGFRTGRIGVLVATDVAARGIDVDDVDAVINFDIPQSFEYYVHRIGRTGRAGKQGVSQTLVSNSKQVATLKALMRATGCEINEARLPTGADLMEKTISTITAEMQKNLTKPGKAAKMLVQHLTSTLQVSEEEAAFILAEKLLGGDAKFTAPVIEERRNGKLSSGSASSGFEGRSSMVNVTANIGRNARITPNHLVGAIAEMLDIPGSAIGKIEIRENSSIIGLREDTALALMQRGNTIRIKGESVEFTVPRKKHSTRSAGPRKPDGSASFKKNYGDKRPVRSSRNK